MTLGRHNHVLQAWTQGYVAPRLVPGVDRVRRRPVLTLTHLVVSMALVSACSTSTPNRREAENGADHRQLRVAPTRSGRSGEPAQGLALVRRHLGQTDFDPVGNTDGTLLLEYQRDSPLGCYYRTVRRDGTVRGVFVRGLCREVDAGLASYLAFKPMDSDTPGNALSQAVDLAYSGHEAPVAADDPGRSPGPGDTYLGLCSELGAPVGKDPIRRGCAYSPQGRTFYRLRSALTIDPAGRVWSIGPGHVLHVTQESTGWLPSVLAGVLTPPARFRFPDDPLAVLGSTGNSAAAWVEGGDGFPMWVTDDLGRSWRPATFVPSQVRDPSVTIMLPDSRLLLGPRDGQIFRATDATNTSFAALEAGPIATVYSAGDRLYGVAEDSDRRLRGWVWMSQDEGSTWRQVIGTAGASAPTTPVSADQLSLPRQPSVAALIDRLPLKDVAATSSGLVLVLYEKDNRDGDGTTSAWRLYDQRDRTVTEGIGANSVDTAGDGFILSTRLGMRFVDKTGAAVRIRWSESGAHRVALGDIYVPNLGVVYRPSQRTLFDGRAVPDGLVSVVDVRGRMWALGHNRPGRVIVRSALPGHAWTSRDIGPSIGAAGLNGSGSTLMVVGMRKMYLSTDGGNTWTILTHGASVYEGVPGFVVRPDGSIIAGDERAGFRESTDLRTFHATTMADAFAPTAGRLFVRGTGSGTEVSRDRMHWVHFTPSAARALLAIRLP